MPGTGRALACSMGFRKGVAQWFPAFTARQASRNARADVVSKHTLWLLVLGRGRSVGRGGERCRWWGE